jgi:hypothetical protein
MTFKLKLQPRTTLSGKVSAQFPASVTGVNPLIVTNNGGSIVISFDSTFLDDIIPFPTFTSLEDTPNSYAGETGKIVAVNAGENALEFVQQARSDLRWVNVLDHGAVGDGVADDTSAIQDAIDFMFAEDLRTVYIPAGRYKITSSLYLDPPNNLRVNLANPPVFAFSASLIGDPGVTNQELQGTFIEPDFNTAPALYVGPGQGMMVQNLQIIGPSGLTRKQQHSGGIGIAMTGASGGSTRSRIENCTILNFYCGIRTGANGFNTLCDENYFFKIHMSNCYQGFHFSQTNNFINMLVDCQPGATLGVVNDVGCNANIYGGNYSCTANSGGYLIDTVSALTATNIGSGFDYTFTARILGPDTNWTAGFNPPLHSIAAFETEHFGIIPCTITAYDTGTSVASFKFWRMFSLHSGGLTNLETDTELEAELQACDRLWAAEQVTTFTGGSMVIDGVHLENFNTPTCLIDGAVGFGSNRPVTIRNLFCNWDPITPGVANSAGSERVIYLCGAAHFPFITSSSAYNTGGTDIIIENSNIGNVLSPYSPMLIDIKNAKLKIEGCRQQKFNIRSGHGGGIAYADSNESWASAGNFPDEMHNGGGGSNFAETFRQFSQGFAPAWGYRPAPWATPIIRELDFPRLHTATMIAISPTAVDYGILWGGQRYQISGSATWDPTEPKSFWSDHNYYSYGQDLTTTNLPGLTWSYRGKSWVVYCTDTDAAGFLPKLIFPGLCVLLNDGATDQPYLVTSVCPDLGYFTVAWATQLNSNGVTVGGQGAKNVTFTGTTIGQEPYDIRILDQPPTYRATAQSDRTTDTALSNITGLSATLVASRTYEFSATLFCTCAGAGGAKVAIGGTATATSIVYGAKTYTGATLNTQDRATALGSAVGASTTAVDRIEIEGSIVTNAAGTLTVQFAQNVASGTSSVLVGSTFKIRDV